MSNEQCQTTQKTVISQERPNDGREWAPQCARCGSSLERVGCLECGGEGYIEHDCGEDCCSCAEPEPNVLCTTCWGRGGWWRCMSTNQKCAANPMPGRDCMMGGTPEWFVVDDAADSEQPPAAVPGECVCRPAGKMVALYRREYCQFGTMMEFCEHVAEHVQHWIDSRDLPYERIRSAEYLVHAATQHAERTRATFERVYDWDTNARQTNNGDQTDG